MNIAPSSLGSLLRHWHGERGRSQLDLALETGVSQRHLSFVESGRSVPSRRMLLDLADGLKVPLRDRNALLLAAGYAPAHSEAPWDAPEMRTVTDALTRMLRQHEPFPALVLDRHWNVLMTNEAAPALFGRFVDLAARPPPRNLLHLIFDPDGLRPFIGNWRELAPALLQRVHREAVGQVLDEPTRALLAALLAYPDVEARWTTPEPAAPDLPVLPIVLMKEQQMLSYFSMVTTVGTPRIVAAQEFRIESMFPLDDDTEAAHRALLAAPAI